MEFEARSRGHDLGAQTGFTYLGLLFFVVVVGVAIAAVGTVWHTTLQRERETQLLFVGEQFSRAIESYYRQSPGAGQFPKALADLLLDDRFPVVRRHLRRLYRDPMTGSSEWGLVTVGGRIVGVYSLSEDNPIKTAGLDRPGFAEAQSYQDWKFVFNDTQSKPPGAPSSGTAPVAGPATGGQPEAGPPAGTGPIPARR